MSGGMSRLQFLLLILIGTVAFSLWYSVKPGPASPEDQVRDAMYSYVNAWNDRNYEKFCEMTYRKDLQPSPGSTKPDITSCAAGYKASNHPTNSVFVNDFLHRLDSAKIVVGGSTQAGSKSHWATVDIPPFTSESLDSDGTTYMLEENGKWYVARALYYSTLPGANGLPVPLDHPQFVK